MASAKPEKSSLDIIERASGPHVPCSRTVVKYIWKRGSGLAEPRKKVPSSFSHDFPDLDTQSYDWSKSRAWGPHFFTMARMARTMQCTQIDRGFGRRDTRASSAKIRSIFGTGILQTRTVTMEIVCEGRVSIFWRVYTHYCYLHFKRRKGQWPSSDEGEKRFCCGACEAILCEGLQAEKESLPAPNHASRCSLRGEETVLSVLPAHNHRWSTSWDFIACYQISLLRASSTHLEQVRSSGILWWWEVQPLCGKLQGNSVGCQSAPRLWASHSGLSFLFGNLFQVCQDISVLNPDFKHVTQMSWTNSFQERLVCICMADLIRGNRFFWISDIDTMFLKLAECELSIHFHRPVAKLAKISRMRWSRPFVRLVPLHPTVPWWKYIKDARNINTVHARERVVVRATCFWAY